VLYSAHRGLNALGGDAKKIELAARFLSSGHSSLNWQCSKCKGPEAADGDSNRKIRNCDSETSVNLAFDFEPSLRRCPWSQVDARALLCVRWFSDWRDYRILPFGGSKLDEEPAFVYEAIDLVSQTMREIEQEQVKKQRAELDRQSKRARNGRR
jgi:hypothetical protein